MLFPAASGRLGSDGHEPGEVKHRATHMINLAIPFVIPREAA